MNVWMRMIAAVTVVMLLLSVTACGCEHEFKEATCQAPATCELCEKTEGEIGDHQFDAATCKAPKTCKICKATEGEIDDHKFSVATCSAPKTCEYCGTTEGEKLTHDYAAATCESPKTCKLCKGTEGEALGHMWQAVTCQVAKTCSVCKKTEGNKGDHSWIAATCQAPKMCSVCKKTEGAVGAHNYAAATCTAPQTCTICGATNGQAAGHNYGGGSSCLSCGAVDPEKQKADIAAALEKAKRYADYMSYDADILKSAVELYKLSGRVSDFNKIVDYVSKLYENSQKIKNALSGMDSLVLESVIDHCDELADFPVYLGDDSSFLSKANSYARKAGYLVSAFNAAYNTYC